EMRGAVNNEGLAVLLKDLLFQNGHGGDLAAPVVTWSGVATEDANFRIRRQPGIHVANGSQELRIHRTVPDAVGPLSGRFPDLRQLGLRDILATNVPVKRR